MLALRNMGNLFFVSPQRRKDAKKKSKNPLPHAQCPLALSEAEGMPHAPCPSCILKNSTSQRRQ
ncbi:hypothetical protein H6G33_13900 [Calothrix sp. FACHB-1219]|uniref:hypothetical protein n=1 Tax=Calothrix sp. FACHB-168 TaxID=2692780 RepID=UPI0016899554|nr:hypothetical protein [Calothrix sp. FACHB-168]MBD2205988.1 hypothetical protein [Calothrix sp. FACHB-168]MBD2218130.1 hypothetical protein [Calothrix sp. FACHB-1219]